MFDCPIYAHERWPLIANEGPMNREYASLIGDGNNAAANIDYIQATGRFAQNNAGEGG